MSGRPSAALYEQAVAAAGVDPADVLVVRVTEAGIEVDALHPDDASWPVRTLRVTADVLRQRLGRQGLEGLRFSIES